VANIAIIGAGTAGLHLGLRLLAQGQSVTIYSERDPAQLRSGRLPNTVAHHGPTRTRERELGVNHWDDKGFGTHFIHFHVSGPQPLSFKGWLDAPSLFVDYRLYQPRLAEDFVARGGRLVVEAVDAVGLGRLAREHDLVVVASGRFGLGDQLFPRVPEHSPHTKPARKLFAALVHGIRFPEPLGMQFIIAPGHGEIFESQVFSQQGLLANLLIEAIPGGALEVLATRRHDEDPRGFEAVLLELLREHAPATYARVDPKEFRVAGPLDWLQGGFTPVVRRGYAPLEGGRFVVAVGDAHVLHDPVGGQGANGASADAWALADVILDTVRAGGAFDESFCQRAEAHTWEAVRPTTYWNNALLELPPPHVLQVMGAASADQPLANALINTLMAPERALENFATPESAAAFVTRHRGGAQGSA
jgi:2-polyprenyl-6-methoxyphenol hydroxylase-like FAD-dependent oxidoreductase